MNELEQRAILKDIGVKTFHKGECTEDFKRETVMLKKQKIFLITFYKIGNNDYC